VVVAVVVVDVAVVAAVAMVADVAVRVGGEAVEDVSVAVPVLFNVMVRNVLAAVNVRDSMLLEAGVVHSPHSCGQCTSTCLWREVLESLQLGSSDGTQLALSRHCPGGRGAVVTRMMPSASDVGAVRAAVARNGRGFADTATVEARLKLEVASEVGAEVGVGVGVAAEAVVEVDVELEMDVEVVEVEVEVEVDVVAVEGHTPQSAGQTECMKLTTNGAACTHNTRSNDLDPQSGKSTSPLSHP